MKIFGFFEKQGKKLKINIFAKVNQMQSLTDLRIFAWLKPVICWIWLILCSCSSINFWNAREHEKCVGAWMWYVSEQNAICEWTNCNFAAFYNSGNFEQHVIHVWQWKMHVLAVKWILMPRILNYMSIDTWCWTSPLQFLNPSV